jgi:hypothetical protein
MAKICTICGIDVSQTRRVKDSKGNYYCQSCYSKRAPGAAVPAALVVPAPAAPRKAAKPAPKDDNMYDLVVEEGPKQAEPLVACSECKRLVPERSARFEDDAFVCMPCVQKRNAVGKPTRAESRRPAPDDAAPKPAGFLQSSAGVLLTAIGMVVATVLACFVYGYIHQNSLLGALIFGGVFWGYCLILGVLFMLSMLAASWYMSGMEFGNVFLAFGKAIVVVTVDQLAKRFLQGYDSLAMIIFLIEPALIIAMIMLLYRLDFGEALILMFANWLLSFMAGMFLAAAMFSLVISARSGMHLPTPSGGATPSSFPAGFGRPARPTSAPSPAAPLTAPSTAP